MIIAVRPHRTEELGHALGVALFVEPGDGRPNVVELDRYHFLAKEGVKTRHPRAAARPHKAPKMFGMRLASTLVFMRLV